MKTIKFAVRKNVKAAARKQKGVALLFTLSILSVALITVLIFSSNAITNRKVAGTFADNTAARFLADGTVDRALTALMNSEKFNFVCSNYKATQKYINAANRGACDFIWHIEKQDLYTFNKGPIRYASQYYDYDDPRCPSWEYVVFKDNNGSSSSDKIFGRYAYVAISHNDQLNANAIGNRPTGVDSNMIARRLGRYTSEPQFILKKTVDKSLWDESSRINSDKIADAFRQQHFDAENDGWSELDVFFNDVTGHAASGKQDRTLKLMLEQYFGLDVAGDYNKFSVQGNVLDVSNPPSGGQSYRFSLNRTDWASIDLGTVMNGIPWFANGTLDQGARNQTVANLINYCAPATRPPVTDNGDWVNGEPSYTGNKRTPYINEVAGRVQFSGMLGNKISIPKMLSFAPPKYAYDVHYENCSYEANLTLQVELVNMFPSSGDFAALSVNPPVLYGKLTFETFDGANGTWAERSTDFSANADLSITNSEHSASGYPCYSYTVNLNYGGISTHTVLNSETDFPDPAPFENDLKIRNPRLTINRVILHTTDRDSQNADLSLMPQEVSVGEGHLLFSGEPVVVDGIVGAVDMQTNDPRCNLGRNNWSYIAVNEGNWDTNLGQQNTTVNVPSNSDPENTKNPAFVSDNNHISTAFIRHDNMQSLWELGAISRGEIWRTINLKRARVNATAMGNYEDGDGHILDHVTMHPMAMIDHTDPGFINLNTSSDFGGEAAPFVFKALFNNFPQTTNGNYADLDKYPGSSSGIKIIEGKSIDSTDSDADKCAQQLADAVTRVMNNESTWTRRTAVMPYDDATADQFDRIIPTSGNDAQREEIFARIVNLLKWTRQKTTGATILVIAQTIKDVGGATLTYEFPDSSETGQSLDDYLRTHFGHRNFAIGTGQNLISDGFPSAGSTLAVKFGKYDIGFDQILGESKLIVRLKWDNKANNNQGAWKVMRKEYVY